MEHSKATHEANLTDYHTESATSTPTHVPHALPNATHIASLMQATTTHLKAHHTANLTQATSQVTLAYLTFWFLFDS